MRRTQPQANRGRPWAKIRALSATAVLCLPSLALADWSASIGHNSEFSDNADLSETDTRDEREDRTWLRVGADLERQNWQLQSQYQATNVHFDSDSLTPQPDDVEYSGSTEFVGLFSKRRLSLLARHQRENFINQVGGLELQRDLRSRDIITLAPSWNFISTQAHTLSLGAYFFDVTNDEGPTNGQNNNIDSETSGVQLSYDRRITKVDTIGLRANSVSTSYDVSLPDNNTDTIQLYYSVDLRQLSYSIALGASQSEFGSLGKTDSPSADIQVAFETGKIRLGFASLYLLTDTTRGNQGTGTTDQRQNFGNGDATNVDRFELFSNQLQMNYDLTSRWQVNGTINFNTQDYPDNPLLNQEQFSAAITLSRQQTEKLNWSIFASQQEFDFDDPLSNQSNETTRFGLNLTYRPADDLRYMLSWQQQEREPTATLGQSFDEQTVRVGIEYRLRD